MTGGFLAGPLLTFGLQSSLLLGAVALLVRSTWFESPRSRDVAWRSGVIFSVLLLGLTLGAVSTRVSPDEPVKKAMVHREVLQGPGPVMAQERVRIQSESELGAECRAALMADMAPAAQRASQVRSACEDRARPMVSTFEWIWLLGALACGVRLVGRRIRLRRVIGPTRPVHDPVASGILKRLVRQAGLRGRVELVEAPGLRSPAVLGLRRIGLPDRATRELPAGELEAVLAHEVAHLRRRDPHWIAVMDVLEVCFWFQPLLYRARAGMLENAEILCDESAVRWTRSPMDLARSLLRVGEWMVGMASPAPELGVARGPSGTLSGRIHRILGDGPGAGSGRWLPTLGVIGLVAGLVSLVPTVEFHSGVQVDIEIRSIALVDVDR